MWLEPVRPLNPPMPRKCHSEAVNQTCQARVRPRTLTVAIQVVLLSMPTASKRMSLRMWPEKWEGKAAGAGQNYPDDRRAEQLGRQSRHLIPAAGLWRE